MKLVKNARQSWRWWSVQAMTLQGAAAGAWLAVPDDMRASVPSEWLAVAAIALTGLGILGRLVDQGGSNGDT
jgi:hypothetical protein